MAERYIGFGCHESDKNGQRSEAMMCRIIDLASMYPEQLATEIESTRPGEKSSLGLKGEIGKFLRIRTAQLMQKSVVES